MYVENLIKFEMTLEKDWEKNLRIQMKGLNPVKIQNRIREIQRLIWQGKAQVKK